MARSAGRPVADETVAGTVTRTRPGDVAADARVLHFDQLDEAAQRTLVAVVDGAEKSGPLPGLATGDVVVYTDYYRVI